MITKDNMYKPKEENVQKLKEYLKKQVPNPNATIVVSKEE